MIFSSLVHDFLERLFRVLHHTVGPTTRAISEAQNALRGREYYELYDDRYRALKEMKISDREFLGIVTARTRVYEDFEQLRRSGMIPGPGATLLDLGCGEGDNAAHFARLGYRVTGIDLSPTAIEVATERAHAQALSIDYRIDNVLTLAGLADASFDFATDIGCLHMLVRARDRRDYLDALYRVLRPGGGFFLFNRLAPADVFIADEDAHILRSITFVERRRLGRTGGAIRMRGCGFRNASLHQYKKELEAGGFEVMSTARHQAEGFGMLLARVVGNPRDTTT